MANLVADVRALSAGQFPHLMVYGATAIGDGGGGFYVWDAAATTADDGADWLKPTSVDAGSPGRWMRVWSAAGDITAFGRSLIAASDAAAARTLLEIPASGLVTVTEAGATRTTVAGDKANFVRHTNTGTKGLTVAPSVHADGDVLNGFNAAGTGDLTIAGGAGVTLTGSLIFGPGKAYSIRCTSATAADVFGGTAS